MNEAPSSTRFVGIDIGGTHTRIGAFASLESPAFSLLARFHTAGEYAEQLERIAAAIAGAGGCAGAGISVGAQVARDGQAVLTAPNLPDYVGQPLVADLAARLSCPLRLAHDGVCGLLGEARFGALRGVERAAYVTLSTGTGAAIRLATPAAALAISIQLGHQILDGNPLPCLCGQIGCLETITGGRQLALRLGQSPAEVADPAFWELFCAKLAVGLMNLAQLTRVEVVALGGGIALGRPELLPRLRAALRARLRDASLEVRAAALGEDAPLVGAAQLLAALEGSIVH